MNVLFFKKIIRPFIQGLSLVEILIVLGLFSTISTIAIATLFNTQAINVRLTQTQSIMDNVNLSLQTVTRDIRYGSFYYCNNEMASSTPTLRKGCPLGTSGGGTYLYFKPTDRSDERDRAVYYVSNGILYKTEFPHSGATTTYQMTSADVYITQFRFFVDNAYSLDGTEDIDNLYDDLQPKVSLFISGRAQSYQVSQAPVSFNIQTTISSRVLDL